MISLSIIELIPELITGDYSSFKEEELKALYVLSHTNLINDVLIDFLKKSVIDFPEEIEFNEHLKNYFIERDIPNFFQWSEILQRSIQNEENKWTYNKNQIHEVLFAFYDDLLVKESDCVEYKYSKIFAEAYIQKQKYDSQNLLSWFTERFPPFRYASAWYTNESLIKNLVDNTTAEINQIDIFNKPPRLTLLGSILVDLGDFLIERGDSKQASTYYEQAIACFNNAFGLWKSNNAKEKRDTVVDLSMSYVKYAGGKEFHSNPVEVEEAYLMALEPLIQYNFKLDNVQASLEKYRGDYLSSEQYWEISIDRYPAERRHIENQEITFIYESIARCLTLQGRHNAAYHLLLRTLTAHEAHPESYRSKTYKYYWLGKICYNIGNYKGAVEYFEKCYALYVQHKYGSPAIGYLCVEISNVFIELNNWENAQLFIRQAFDHLIPITTLKSRQMLQAYFVLAKLKLYQNKEKGIYLLKKILIEYSKQSGTKYHPILKPILSELIKVLPDSNEIMSYRHWLDTISQLQKQEIRLNSNEYKEEELVGRQKNRFIRKIMGEFPYLMPISKEKVLMSRTELPFFPGTYLTIIKYLDSDFLLKRYVLHNEDLNKIFVLNLSNTVLYNIAETYFEKSDFSMNEEMAKLYIKFFFDAVRGRHGRFYIVESIEEVPWRYDIYPEEKAKQEIELRDKIKPMLYDSNEKFQHTFRCSIIFKNNLFEANVHINNEGNISLSDNDLIMEDLFAQIDKFD